MVHLAQYRCINGACWTVPAELIWGEERISEDNTPSCGGRKNYQKDWKEIFKKERKKLQYGFRAHNLFCQTISISSGSLYKISSLVLANMVINVIMVLHMLSNKLVEVLIKLHFAISSKMCIFECVGCNYALRRVLTGKTSKCLLERTFHVDLFFSDVC